MVTMELIPPSLEDMGHTFWGDGWRDYLAEIMGVDADEVLIWETEPDKRPPNLQDALENIGMGRLGEIELMLGHMKEAGLQGR